MKSWAIPPANLPIASIFCLLQLVAQPPGLGQIGEFRGEERSARLRLAETIKRGEHGELAVRAVDHFVLASGDDPARGYGLPDLIPILEPGEERGKRGALPRAGEKRRKRGVRFKDAAALVGDASRRDAEIEQAPIPLFAVRELLFHAGAHEGDFRGAEEFALREWLYEDAERLRFHRAAGRPRVGEGRDEHRRNVAFGPRGKRDLGAGGASGEIDVHEDEIPTLSGAQRLKKISPPLKPGGGFVSGALERLGDIEGYKGFLINDRNGWHRCAPDNRLRDGIPGGAVCARLGQ